jgi:hypothetical protein
MLSFKNSCNAQTVVVFNGNRSISIIPDDDRYSTDLSPLETKMLADNLIRHVYPELVIELEKLVKS